MRVSHFEGRTWEKETGAEDVSWTELAQGVV